MVSTKYAVSAAGVQSGCYWNVPGAGNFNTKFNADWTTALTSAVSGLVNSLTTINAGTSPFARGFESSNIGLSLDGAITLTVPGGQTGVAADGSAVAISSAQMTTGYSDILYGSVRTVAMISGVAGTTNAFSFYSNDTQEVS